MSEKKSADLSNVGRGVGKGLVMAGSATKDLLHGAGQIGQGIAESVGLHPTLGYAAGAAAPVAGAAYATSDVPAVRRWRIRHQIFTPYDAGTRPGDY